MKDVTIYSTPTCHYCHAAKDFFKENKIAFTDKDVVVDRVAGQEAIKKSGQMGVPVIDVAGEIIIGFDEDRLRELLGVK